MVLGRSHLMDKISLFWGPIRCWLVGLALPLDVLEIYLLYIDFRFMLFSWVFFSDAFR